MGQVGGYKGRREYLITGDPLHQIACVSSAKSGQICLSKEAVEALGPLCQVQAQLSGDFLLLSLSRSPSSELPAVAEYLPKLRSPLEIEYRCRSFVQPFVLQHIDQHMPVLTGLRNVTVNRSARMASCMPLGLHRDCGRTLVPSPALVDKLAVLSSRWSS
jgi:hypothetical protein